jgi:hypothetical protein
VAVLVAALASLALLPRAAPLAQAPRPQPDSDGVPDAAVDDERPLPVDPSLALVEASVRQTDLEDGVLERVVFCFSRPVRQAGLPDRLVLLGPDVDVEVAAESVDLLVSDPNCLLAGFASGIPVRRYTVAVAEEGAATDLDSRSVSSTVPAPDVAPQTRLERGRTSGPDLVAVTLDRTLNRIAFRYDEPLDETVVADPRAFRYTLPSGATRRGEQVVAVDDNQVVVSFASSGLEPAARASTLAGAVRDRDGTASPPGVEVLQPEGTTTPELVDVEPVAGSDVLFDFTFDGAVGQSVPSRFVLYRPDATPLRAVAVVRPGPAVVRALVPDAEGARVVLAAAETAAVRDLGTGAAPNEVGVAGLAAFRAVAGRTTGPDLVSARLGASDSLLTLVFDQPLEDDTDAVNRLGIVLVLADGRQVPTERLAQVRGREVILLVEPAAAAAARRVVASRGAVTGAGGERSAPASRILEN